MTVTVVDDGGEPLDGIDLTASWEADGGGSVNETTRSNGQVLIDVPEGADVTITVDDDQYVRNEPYVVEGATTGDVEVDVRESGTATIQVVDDDGPLESAIVRLHRSGNYVVNVLADSDGTYTTDAIEQGTYSLTVYKAGYLRNRSTLTVDGDVSREVSVTEAARLVTFTVTDDHFDSPRPLRDATISVGGNTITTVSNGEATIQLPVNQDYEYEVTKEGYETVTESFRVHQSEVEHEISIQREDAIEIATQNDQVVVGQSTQVTVTDEYGDPVAGAAISVGGQEVAETDDEGQALVSIESAGENEVTATSDDLTASVSVEGVEANQDTPTDTPSATPTDTPTEESTEEPTDTPTDTGTATPTATDDATTTAGTSITGPGFTGLSALVAVVLAVALLIRRQ